MEDANFEIGAGRVREEEEEEGFLSLRTSLEKGVGFEKGEGRFFYHLSKEIGPAETDRPNEGPDGEGGGNERKDDLWIGGGEEDGGAFSPPSPSKKSGKRPFLNCDGDERNIGLAKQVSVHHRNTYTRTPDSPPKNGPPTHKTSAHQ